MGAAGCGEGLGVSLCLVIQREAQLVRGEAAAAPYRGGDEEEGCSDGLLCP